MGIPPIFYPLLAAVALALNSLAIRNQVKKGANVWALTAANETIGVALLLAAISFFGFGFYAPADFSLPAVPAGAVIALAFSALLFAIVIYPNYAMYRGLDASEGRLIMQLMNPATMLLGFVFFAERLKAVDMAGVALILAGIFAATYVKGRWHLKADGFKFALLAVALYSAAAATDKFAIAYFPPLVYAIPMFVLPALLSYSAVARNNKIPDLKKALLPGFWDAFFVAATNIGAYFFVLVSFRELPLSIAVPVIGISAILTVLLGAILLGEKDRWRWKLLGAVLAFAGIMLIGG